MKTRRCKAGGWMGRIVALLFAVQMALLGFSVAASAQIMPRDQFGNVLCLSGGSPADHAAPDGAEHHGGKLECCTLGCPMLGGWTPPPVFGSPLVRQAPVLAVPFVFYEHPGSRAVETPRNTRGPPSAA